MRADHFQRCCEKFNRQQKSKKGSLFNQYLADLGAGKLHNHLKDTPSATGDGKHAQVAVGKEK